MPQAYKIPLAEPINTRVSAVNASDNSTGYVGIGIVGYMIVGKPITSTAKDARFINCFTATVGQNKYVIKRPGFGTGNTPASGSKGMAIIVWTGQGSKIMSAFGDTNSTLYDSTTSKGAITGYVTGFAETFVGIQATLLMSSSDSTGWYYDTAVGVATEITDAQFPGKAGYTLAGTFVVMDGYACIMTTDSKLWASDLNSVTGWTANSYDTANVYPDTGIGLARFKNFIMAFGTESVEFWTNAGLTPFPLARSKAMTMKVGCVHAKTITSISDNVFWCGSTPQGGLSIFQYDGSISRVSTPAIDARLLLEGSTNISLSAIRFYGYSFILVKGGTTTYAYCIEEKMWGEWNSTTPLWTSVVGVSISGTLVNYAVSNVSTTGKVFIMNQASLVFTDDTLAYTATIQTSRRSEGTNKWKFYHYMDIVADTESSASTLTLSCSDDDYATFTTLGTVDLASGGGRITRLGRSRDRAWKLVHAAATPMRLEGTLEGTLSIGTS